jgi:hypothetical protein
MSEKMRYKNGKKWGEVEKPEFNICVLYRFTLIPEHMWSSRGILNMFGIVGFSWISCICWEALAHEDCAAGLLWNIGKGGLAAYVGKHLHMKIAQRACCGT